MIAIVPILPALFPLMALVGWAALSVATLLGLAGNNERRRMLLRFLWKQKYSLLVVLALGGLTWFGLSELMTSWSRAPGDSVAIQSGRDWPMFRGGPDRTGSVGAGELDSAQEPHWSGGFQESFFSSPAVVGNRVFCVGSQGDSGRVFCWDTSSGQLQWVTRPLEMRATFSSPVVVGNLLLCGEGLHTTGNARVFCLDVSQPHQAKLYWSFTTQSHVECTPVVIGDRVYVSAGDDGVYALSLHAKQDERPELLWHVPGSQLPDVETSLLADDQSVFVGAGIGGQCVAVLDATTGLEKARIPFEYPVHAPPAIMGQHLFVGMGNASFTGSQTDRGGAVACIDTVTHRVLWKFSTPASVLGAISVSDGEVLFGCADGSIRGLSLQGQLMHSWDSESPILASLAVTPRWICGVNNDGRCFVLDRQTWTLSWERSLGRDGYFISSPAITEGRIFVGTEKYGLQCFGRRK